MRNYHRFMWGLLAGLAVICVKFLGPDSAVVKSFMLAGSQGEVAFYILVSSVTIVLGGISGLFSKETDPTRILVFCSAFPALVSTASAPQRVAAPANTEYRAERSTTADTSLLAFVIVSPAQAQQQSADPKQVCDEGNFVNQFKSAAKDYFSNPLQNRTFTVVVGSEPQLDVAKARADAFARQSGKYRITVGCQKPNTPYFPIMVADPMDIQAAASVKGEIIGAGWAPADTYLSDYAYRTVIYEAKMP